MELYIRISNAGNIFRLFTALQCNGLLCPVQKVVNSEDGNWSDIEVTVVKKKTDGITNT